MKYVTMLLQDGYLQKEYVNIFENEDDANKFIIKGFIDDMACLSGYEFGDFFGLLKHFEILPNYIGGTIFGSSYEYIVCPDNGCEGRRYMNTISVVINARHGGFSLSKEAMDFLGTKDDFAFSYPDAKTRTNPRLVECVEKLGAKSFGVGSLLIVVEVPSDVKWYISEHDGFERVVESHRCWGISGEYYSHNCSPTEC